MGSYHLTSFGALRSERPSWLWPAATAVLKFPIILNKGSHAFILTQALGSTPLVLSPPDPMGASRPHAHLHAHAPTPSHRTPIGCAPCTTAHTSCKCKTYAIHANTVTLQSSVRNGSEIV